MTIINESGLYSLILRSDKPGAKRFKKWVTSEVLPEVRKTGGYGRKGTPLFLRRYSENHGRVSTGCFSVIQVLATHLYGPLEFSGHTAVFFVQCLMAIGAHTVRLHEAD